MTTETDLQRQIQLALSTPTGRMFRNSVGEGWQGKIISQSQTRITLEHYRRISFGLAPGSSDLIGPQSVVITPSMVGRRIAVFAALEVKTATGRTTPEQKRFIEMVAGLGGMAAVVRDPEEALCIVDWFTK